jgi:hypothetical protein
MAAESLAKVADLVPQFYFDLIGRVAPGAVACVLYGFAIGVDVVALSHLGTGTIVLAGFVLSYVVGLILDLLSEGILKVLASFTSIKPDKKLWDEIEEKKKESTESLLSAPQKTLLTKMMAERSLMRVLVVVSVPFAIDWPIRGSLFPDDKAAILGPVAVTAIAVLLISSFILDRCMQERMRLFKKEGGAK